MQKILRRATSLITIMIFTNSHRKNHNLLFHLTFTKVYVNVFPFRLFKILVLFYVKRFILCTTFLHEEVVKYLCSMFLHERIENLWYQDITSTFLPLLLFASELWWAEFLISCYQLATLASFLSSWDRIKILFTACGDSTSYVCTEQVL